MIKSRYAVECPWWEILNWLVQNTVGHAENSKEGNVKLGFREEEEKTPGMGCSSISNYVGCLEGEK